MYLRRAFTEGGAGSFTQFSDKAQKKRVRKTMAERITPHAVHTRYHEYRQEEIAA